MKGKTKAGLRRGKRLFRSERSDPKFRITPSEFRIEAACPPLH